jgi:phosphate transport system protein
MVEHTVKAFDDEIGALRGLIAEMGGLAEVGIAQSVEALVKRDTDLAAEVIRNDARLDALEVEVDRLAVRIIALRAPMADDLRDVISALKISGIIERIGDYAKNIAKRAGEVEGRAKIEPLTLIPTMAGCLCRARCAAGRGSRGPR